MKVKIYHGAEWFTAIDGMKQRQLDNLLEAIRDGAKTITIKGDDSELYLILDKIVMIEVKE